MPGKREGRALLFLANRLSNIRPADAEHFHMAVGEVFPVVEGKAAVDVNVEQAACGVGFLLVGEALGGRIAVRRAGGAIGFAPGAAGRR